jgi:t-SNARE complex subunit (syntaxin)
MQHRSSFLIIFTVVLTISAFNLSCASTSNGKSQFERFSSTFLKETNKAQENIVTFNQLVKELSDYENKIGLLSNTDYENAGKLSKEVSDVKTQMETQIETARDIGRSVTSDGYYRDTNREVSGWDAASYTDLHVETTLNALEQNHTDSINKYKNIDFKLFEKPNKPFNTNATKLVTEVKISIASAKSDISVKDWKAGKANIDKANAALKNALQLDLNNIEQYQVSLLQNDLKDAANKVSLGLALNETGSLLKNAGEAAVNILGGIGSVLKGVGETLKENK